MLVLARKIGQEIIINNEVRIRVLAVRGRRVRLGVDAPDHLRVYRKEGKADAEVGCPSDKSLA